MASNLSPEDRAFFEAVLEKAEPYPEDDEIWVTLDGKCDINRAMATLAKMALEGRLR
ncbi:hypothetical protein N510_001076 [Firmicutes bacterium ASF500]|nr:hypothetical protein N510_001076 [Firmicutes bacterium ASF500]